ncbi:MAG: hypothetical protein H7301_07395 [Cryobacterium sp.]|nr:hypothetical protein [Oligoflexia bacterium]
MKTAPMTLLVLVSCPFILLFLVWLERNMAIPVLGNFLMKHGLGLPWIFVDGGPGTTLFADAVLIAAVSAVLIFSNRLLKSLRFNPDLTLLLSLPLPCILLISLWQPTGVVLLNAIPSALIASIVSLISFWVFLGLAWQTKRPLLWTALAGLATPLLSLDRALVTVASVLVASILLHQRHDKEK